MTRQEEFAAASEAAGLPWPIAWVAETGSTNVDLRALAARGAPHGTALVADAQTAGRGRLGRVWQTPGGSLALSVILRPLLGVDRLGLVSLAAARVVAEACGPEYRIKWPNDVLGPEGHKVAGILAEIDTEGRRIKWVVVGIGLNVTDVPPDVPNAGAVTSIDGRPRDRAALAASLVRGLLAASARLGTDPDAEVAAWRERSHTIGRRVAVGDVEGEALDVAFDGALLVRDAAGVVHRILAGDVSVAHGDPRG